jgi:hypothetical protein
MTHKYIELNWENGWSPLYGTPIIIPANTILWRSYDTSYPAISNRFAYYSSKNVAEGYKSNTKQLGQFITTRHLKILDLRFMKVLLSRLIQTNSSDKTLQSFASAILSFGLCSLRHQINLVKMRYGNLKNSNEYNIIQQSLVELERYYTPKSIIEQVGVRIAETTNDIYTMGFLQALFDGVVDGFISPRLYSPFHVEKKGHMMSPELIIFNPQKSCIKQMIEYPDKSKIIIKSIQELIYQNHGHIILENIKKNGNIMDIKMEFFMNGGNSLEHYLDEAENLLNKNDKNSAKNYKNGQTAGNKLRNKVDIFFIETPSPCVPVSPFEIGI